MTNFADINEVSGGVLAAQGFVAVAVSSGIKPPPALDLVMIHSQYPASAAATVTRNVFRAAPTYVTQEAVADGKARTIIINSGNANAGTGRQGMKDARQMAALAAEATGVEVLEVVVCSTGHIGDILPMDKVAAGIEQLGGRLSRVNPEKIARGIMTTDTVPKHCAVEFTVGGRGARLGGICKGAGMICPNMATMLCFITTDVAIAATALQDALNWSVARSFNCISVDGDMSTNDTVALLANGQAGNETITGEVSEDYAVFRAALLHVTQDLAKKIAADGEGATKFVTVKITGAASYEEARTAGRAVTNYSLLKTAIYGGDFNWGRIAAAVGSSEVPFDPDKAAIKIAGITVFAEGKVRDFDLQQGRAQMAAEEIEIEIDLARGDESLTLWTCDLTPEYVYFNAEYDASDLAGVEED